MKNQFLTKAASYLILGFTIVALLIVSCAKDNDDEAEGSGDGYYITFKLDGVANEIKDYVIPPWGSLYGDRKTYYGGFGATWAASSIDFWVYDSNPIVVKKDYSGYVLRDTLLPDGTIYTFTEGSLINYIALPLTYSTGKINPNVHVQINEITATSLRGTFRGTLKSDNGKPDIEITDGNFFVKRSDQTN